jgi:hypothetical protein
MSNCPVSDIDILLLVVNKASFREASVVSLHLIFIFVRLCVFRVSSCWFSQVFFSCFSKSVLFRTKKLEQNELVLCVLLLSCLTMPKPLSKQSQEMIAKLIRYFEQERDNRGPLLPLGAVREVSLFLAIFYT